MPVFQRGHLGAELSSYLDGRLSDQDRARVEVHLAACGHCRQELASLRHTVGLLRQLPAEAPRRPVNLPADAPPPLAPWELVLAPARLRLATAVAGLLLVALIVADLFVLFPQQPAAAPTDSASTAVASPPAAPRGPGGPARPAGPALSALEAPSEPTPTAAAMTAPSPLAPEQRIGPAAAYGWPVRQTELALLGVVVALVALLLAMTWRRVRRGA